MEKFLRAWMSLDKVSIVRKHSHAFFNIRSMMMENGTAFHLGGFVANEAQGIAERILRCMEGFIDAAFIPLWSDRDRAWLEGLFLVDSPLADLRYGIVLTVIHEGLLRCGREMYQQHIADPGHVYVEHCRSPKALAYALANGGLSEEERARINYDGADPETFKQQANGLPCQVLTALVGSRAVEQSQRQSPVHFCEGGACDDPN